MKSIVQITNTNSGIQNIQRSPKCHWGLHHYQLHRVTASFGTASLAQALKVTDAENARRFGEAFLAKGLVEKLEKTKEAGEMARCLAGIEWENPCHMGISMGNIQNKHQ